MIEKIIYKKKLLALIVRGKYRNKKGITFFTPNESTQQFGYMKHKKSLNFPTVSAIGVQAFEFLSILLNTIGMVI